MRMRPAHPEAPVPHPATVEPGTGSAKTSSMRVGPVDGPGITPEGGDVMGGTGFVAGFSWQDVIRLVNRTAARSALRATPHRLRSLTPSCDETRKGSAQSGATRLT